MEVSRSSKVNHFNHSMVVQLAVPGKEEPIELAVPWRVLGYLDLYATRETLPDGSSLYFVDDTAKLEQLCVDYAGGGFSLTI